MERAIRKPFQGVLNIIKFNWHFYILALSFITILLIFNILLTSNFNLFIYSLITAIILGTSLSLLASFYIYDVSNLYSLKWLDDLQMPKNAFILNINAGFDETSTLLQIKYPDANIKALDFYNPLKHTEISIERARKAYPPYPGTELIETTNINIATKSIDGAFLILAAHEIRDKKEQIIFFKQLKATLKADGKIVVVEHNRDFYNFLVYNFGCFHFFSPRRWRNVFKDAGLSLMQTNRITPFINVYILN